jgi:hypothetical protein
MQGKRKKNVPTRENKLEERAEQEINDITRNQYLLVLPLTCSFNCEKKQSIFACHAAK